MKKFFTAAQAKEVANNYKPYYPPSKEVKKLNRWGKRTLKRLLGEIREAAEKGYYSKSVWIGSQYGFYYEQWLLVLGELRKAGYWVNGGPYSLLKQLPTAGALEVRIGWLEPKEQSANS